VEEKGEEDPRSLRSTGETPAPAPAGEEIENRPTKAAATRLPSGWQPDAEGRRFADEQLGMGAAERELPKFRDYWGAKPSGATSLDWAAAWRSWIRKADQFGQKPRAGPRRGTFPAKRSALSVFDEMRNGANHAKSDESVPDWASADYPGATIAGRIGAVQELPHHDPERAL